MKTNNCELFLSTYKEELRKSHNNNPEYYGWPISELEEVFKRMSNAIERGSFNKDSIAFKNTCKKLKIKYTYRDIETFINTI
jgi:hypothetical protein